MDQHSEFEYEQFGPERPTGANPLAIVGFIFAFCVPPVGFLLSLIAVFRSPRGFAVAGLVISLLLSAVLAAVAFFFSVGWGPIRDISSVVTETTLISNAIDGYSRQNNGALPASLDALGLPAETLSDPWGNAYRYDVSPDGTTWTLTVAGPDGSYDDAATVTVTQNMSPNEIGDRAGNAWGEKLFRDSMGAPAATPTPTPAPAPEPAPAPANP